ncbi:hypothetical protein GCM10007890_47540 [Methylobacterium tardum]|uniref:Uncharacterized protein n=1 Tax=Methylobacterium tardum TaxID=374432 RepID=A0AA37TKP2_9HYPH|nr:hypothetical protein GCM10007890_47540 [Methylobacterium tardum]
MDRDAAAPTGERNETNEQKMVHQDPDLPGHRCDGGSGTNSDDDEAETGGTLRPSNE